MKLTGYFLILVLVVATLANAQTTTTTTSTKPAGTTTKATTTSAKPSGTTKTTTARPAQRVEVSGWRDPWDTWGPAYGAPVFEDRWAAPVVREGPVIREGPVYGAWEGARVYEEPLAWAPREFASVGWVEEPRAYSHYVTREYEKPLEDAVFTYTDEHHTPHTYEIIDDVHIPHTLEYTDGESY